MSLNIAHRGFSGHYPENTMLAFQKAADIGADGIELDVHLSKDGVAVIIHDETVDRTTNGTGRVCDMTALELAALDAHGPFLGKYDRCPIPTLDAYFAWVATTGMLTNVELKTNNFEYPGIEQIVWDLICKYTLQDRVVISSFNHYSALRMKALAPDLPCGFLVDSWLIEPGAYTKAQGMNTYHPHFRNVTPLLMEQTTAAGLEVYTYTVNEAESVAYLAKLGVHGIISNFPDMAGQVIAEVASKK